MIEPECPGPDCLMYCEHDVIDRHREPEFRDRPRSWWTGQRQTRPPRAA